MKDKIITEEQLISFDTAKLAKEKEFDIPWEIGNNKGVFNAYRKDGKLGSPLLSDGIYDTQAPTQSLLKKWIREVHKMDVNVERDYDGWCWKITEFSEGNMLVKGGSCERPNYETELEIGLFEALKLINV